MGFNFKIVNKCFKHFENLCIIVVLCLELRKYIGIRFISIDAYNHEKTINFNTKNEPSDNILTLAFKDTSSIMGKSTLSFISFELFK